MRIRLLGVLVVALLGASLAQAGGQRPYYLAVGDSLAIGVQPNGSGDVATNQGYVDDLYALLRLRVPGLALEKLGCSGETAASMVDGGECTYAEGNQLAAAVDFIEVHRVVLITIDIGANDVDHCISLAGIDQTCLTDGATSVSGNLPYILEQLRAAAGPHTPIVAMNYYDPFLAAWVLAGTTGQTLANESLQATTDFNTLLEGVYQSFHVPVADVVGAYHISDFNVIPTLGVPLNVFLTLTWTWMGAPAPFGPDIHPNAAGYAVIAGAFAKTVAAQ
jgi:lysophospholipase L1-like esterase